MKSKERQEDWLAPRSPQREPVPPNLADVIRKRGFLDAVTYARECAGLDEKQVFGPLGWKPDVWSRIFTIDAKPKNPAYFDARRIVPLVKLTNEAPLMWLVHQCGYDWSTIRPYQTALERENFELKQLLAQKDRDLAVAAQLMAGRVPK